MCAGHEEFVSLAQEAENLRELAKTDDDAHHRRTQLLLELQANGLTVSELLGTQSPEAPKCLSKTSVSLPPNPRAVFI
jgi:site-specific recombinase XerD